MRFPSGLNAIKGCPSGVAMILMVSRRAMTAVNCAPASAVGAMRDAARICCSARTSPPPGHRPAWPRLRRQLQRDGLVSFAFSSLSLLCCFVLFNERDEGGGDRRHGENCQGGDRRRGAQPSKPALLAHVIARQFVPDFPWIGAARSSDLVAELWCLQVPRRVAS